MARAVGDVTAAYLNGRDPARADHDVRHGKRRDRGWGQWPRLAAGLPRIGRGGAVTWAADPGPTRTVGVGRSPGVG